MVPLRAGHLDFEGLGHRLHRVCHVDAKAEKDDKTYKISGNATGVDMANPMQPVTKPFEIEVTCP